MKKPFFFLLLLMVAGIAVPQSTNKSTFPGTVSAQNYTASATSGPAFTLSSGAKVCFNGSTCTAFIRFNGTDFVFDVPPTIGYVFNVNGTKIFMVSSAGALSGITSLALDDTDSAYDLIISSTSTLTTDRTLTLDVDNGSRTLRMGGNLTLGGSFTTSGSSSLTLATSGNTNITLPTAGTLATLAGSEIFTNKIINSGKFDSLLDLSANEFLVVSSVASADDWITVYNSTGAAPVGFLADGNDLNIDFSIDAKGTGDVNIGSSATGYDVTLAGGSGATGCTVTNTSGNFACSGGLTWGGGDQIASTFQRTVTVDIASVSPASCLDTAVSPVTGCVTGSPCALGFQPTTANIAFSCMCSGTNTGTIRACNVTAGSINPVSQSFQFRVFNP